MSKKGWIRGLSVGNDVYVYRDGKKVMVAKYKDGRKVWDEKKEIGKMKKGA